MMRVSTHPLRLLAGAIAIVGALTAVLPVAAAAATDVTRVASSFESSCALRADGRVSCWGTNSDHQMADGTDDPGPQLTPGLVLRTGGTLGHVTRITAGGRHYCAILADTTLRCWGYNSDGQLGTGDIDPVRRAIVVKRNGVPLTGVKDVTGGWEHTCALMSSGKVLCFGGDANGSIGDGPDTDRQLVPAFVTKAGGGTLTGVTAIAAGGYHVCALLSDRTMRCWGANEDGQVGDGSKQDRYRAVVVKTAGGATLTGVRAIAAGGDNTCAIRGTSRALLCWGDNTDGQIGDGSTDQRSYPTRVHRGTGFMTGVSSVALDYYHACAIRSSAAWCWGDNATGLSGIGTTDPTPLPVRVHRTAGTLFAASVMQVEASDGTSCLVTKARRAWCWGENDEAQAGTGQTSAPVLLPHKVPVS